MTIVIKVIYSALREDFGFAHILWVYSGPRGVHCWVFDARARRLNNAQRAAIADCFHVYKVVYNYSIMCQLILFEFDTFHGIFLNLFILSGKPKWL